jgi:hypothetical protein
MVKQVSKLRLKNESNDCYGEDNKAIDSKMTSKRDSGNHQYLNQASNFKTIESQIQTERRGDAKLVIKLKNDIQLLNELVTEEKEKNEELDKKLMK